MIQVVCVRWGARKYGATAVNRLYRAVAHGTRAPFKFACISDRDDPGLDPAIVKKRFPEFAIPFGATLKGCRAKLAMFAPGMLEEGLPTIYFDLDTMVRGDIQRIADQLARSPGLYMLQNHYIQFWQIQGLLNAARIDLYYFGNSSVLAFYPERTHFIFTEFNRLIAGAKEPLAKHLRTDERFISWSARGQVRVFPRRLVTKFAEEYMLPFPALEEGRKRLPWVAKRRRGQVAVTFVGGQFKPEKLAALKDGDVLRYKRLKYRGPHDEYRDYWKGAV